MIYQPLPLRCSRCGTIKPHTRQFFAWTNAHGLEVRCLDCRLAYQRRWKDSNREHVRDESRKWKRNNPDKIKLTDVRYKAKNPQKYKEVRQRAAKNWYNKNPSYGITWRHHNLDKIRIYEKTYTQRHPENRQIKNNRRRARAVALPDTFTDAEFRRAKVYFNYRCAYCGSGPKETDYNWVLHQDHYIPLNDTQSCPGTVSWNIVPACQSCNLSKSDQQPDRWLVKKFGPRKAKRIAQRILDYFERVKPKDSH